MWEGNRSVSIFSVHRTVMCIEYVQSRRYLDWFRILHDEKSRRSVDKLFVCFHPISWMSMFRQISVSGSFQESKA